MHLKGPYLALDWGKKKIGWATGDELHVTTTVHPVFKRHESSPKWSLTEHDKRWLRQVVDQWCTQTLVLGHPLGLNGQTNSESAGAEALKIELDALLKIPIVLVNEALSTWESRGKKDEDSEAAAILLKDLWETHRRKPR